MTSNVYAVMVNVNDILACTLQHNYGILQCIDATILMNCMPFFLWLIYAIWRILNFIYKYAVENTPEYHLQNEHSSVYLEHKATVTSLSTRFYLVTLLPEKKSACMQQR